MKTTTTNEKVGTLSIDTLRRLALMQHLGENFLIVNGTAYEGNEEESLDEYNNYKINLEEDESEDKGDILAFADWVNENRTEVEELGEDDYSVDYRVLTDDEANQAWEESLDSYIEECIQPELDRINEGQGNLSYYIKFDEETWKRYAKMDGRGRSLSSYDGHEHEETVFNTTFYIYRIN